MLIASGNIGVGMMLLAIAVGRGFYCFGALGTSPHVGIFVPGPSWFRRTVVGISGTFALVGGIAELARTYAARVGSARAVSPDAEELRALLQRYDVPWGTIYLGGGGGGDRIVTVTDLLDAVGGRWDEPTLDRLVRELGGRRETTIDPWSWPRRAIARLRRRETATSDAYVFPEHLPG